MKSTLSFALQRELARIAMIGERYTHLLVIANMEGSRFRRRKNADEEAAVVGRNSGYSLKYKK